jgi:hypothetical protein
MHSRAKNAGSRPAPAAVHPRLRGDARGALRYECLASANLDYSRAKRSRGRALQSEAMSLCLGAACKLNVWSERLRKRQTPRRAPNKALNLFAPCLAFPGSPLDRHSVKVSPLSVNNAGYWIGAPPGLLTGIQLFWAGSQRVTSASLRSSPRWGDLVKSWIPSMPA